MKDKIIQACILFCSCFAIGLISTGTYAKLGFIIGFLGQPFWLYDTFKKKQWGMFVVSLFYTASFANGIIRLLFFKG